MQTHMHKRGAMQPYAKAGRAEEPAMEVLGLMCMHVPARTPMHLPRAKHLTDLCPVVETIVAV